MFIKAKINVGNPSNRAIAGHERDITFDASEISDWESNPHNPDVTAVTFKNGKEVSIMCKPGDFLKHLHVVNEQKRDVEILLDGTRNDLK